MHPPLALLAAALCAFPARSAMPDGRHRSDARRFGLDRPAPADPAESSREDSAKAAVRSFNRESAGGYRRLLRAAQGAGARERAASEVAEAFLRAARPALGMAPSQFRLEAARSDGGIHHFLYSQIQGGIPVELSRIKVHVDSEGSVLSARSDARDASRTSLTPGIPEAAAAAAVASDLGSVSRPKGGRLSLLPLAGGGLRLAWRFKVSGGGGRWVYFIDAADGKVLLRYDEIQGACGYAKGWVYDTDPRVPAAVRPFANQRVFVRDAASFQTTDANGYYCSSTAGKVFSQLQGPFVNVAHFTGPNALFDNSQGVWTTFSSPASSPHPYLESSVTFTTITAPSGACPGGADPVRVLPNFQNFIVGGLSAEGDIVDDDQVQLLDAAGDPVAAYVGDKGSFRGAAAAGTTLRLRLASDGSEPHYGYDVFTSSYFCLQNPAVPGASPSMQWTSTMTYDGRLDEPNLFYHLNKIHDYLNAGPNSARSAYIDKALPVMAGVPNLANSYYDPLRSSLFFGAVLDAFALDASVVRHEYAHFAMDQIYPILNLGQSGAISEGIADYLSASSLNNPKVGEYTASKFGSEGALRDLDSTHAGNFKSYPANWTGEIHEDSLILSQPLWEVRQAAGAACADKLAFRALFFFPDSFKEFLQAMLAVSSLSSSLAPECGASGTRNALISTSFSSHGVSASAAANSDAYEPNDGIQAATDVSTAPSIAATIYPGFDTDFYAVPAGAGALQAVLELPEYSEVPGTYYAYGLTLIDAQSNLLLESYPTVDINPTIWQHCPNDPNDPCRTSQSRLTLDYRLPGPGLYYLIVASGLDDNGSSDVTNSSRRAYSLSVSYPRAGPVGTSIVSAVFDADAIDFSVAAATFPSLQNYAFSYARLRDHALSPLPLTATNEAGTFLGLVSAASANGSVSGRLRLGQGFAGRFPAVGEVHLEVFGINPLGHLQSLGLSAPVRLTAQSASLSAWNNVFNPARGEKATLKYETLEPGRVRLRLFSLAGALVRTFIDEDRPAGKGSLDWDGTNSAGNRVASGIYLLRLDAAGYSKTQKVIVVK
jgi:Zn-dependent metalloprotease